MSGGMKNTSWQWLIFELSGSFVLDILAFCSLFKRRSQGEFWCCSL